MRRFNTEGPVRLDDHYRIPPLERINVDHVLELIQDKRCFVLHAPRQTGKTSALMALAERPLPLRVRERGSGSIRPRGRALADEACFRNEAGRDRSRPIGVKAIRDARERLIAQAQKHFGT